MALPKHFYALLFCGFAVLGAVLYGYDGTYFTGIVAMNPFIIKFGETAPNTTLGYKFDGLHLAIPASFVMIGEAVGSFVAGPIGEKTGRRGAMIAAAIGVIAGTIIQLVAPSWAVIVVGRVVLGLGIGAVSNCVPLYLSEISPTALRGVVVGSWQFFLAIGQVVGACVCQGTQGIASKASYEIPIGVNLLIPTIMLAGVFFIPETPRWLIRHGKIEGARKSLIRINKEDKTFVPEPQLKLMVDDHEAEMRGGQTGSWGELMSDPIERRKFFCAVGILVAQQITGVQFIFSYATVFVRDIGLGSAFLITIIIDVCEVIGVVISFFLIPRYGRRPLLLTTGIAMVVSLLIVGGVGTPSNRSTGENTCIVVFIMIYVLLFNLAFGPLAWVLSTELATGRNRNRITAVATFCFWTVAFVVTFTLPYLFDADKAGLGPMVGYVYAGGCTISVVFVYFMIGETKGRSLEEINEMYMNRVAVKDWKRYETTLQKQHTADLNTNMGASNLSSETELDVFVDRPKNEEAVEGAYGLGSQTSLPRTNNGHGNQYKPEVEHRE
ncbi:hypothetical protein YB2330_000669 [Saitoella coloradoensis]